MTIYIKHSIQNMLLFKISNFQCYAMCATKPRAYDDKAHLTETEIYIFFHGLKMM